MSESGAEIVRAGSQTEPVNQPGDVKRGGRTDAISKSTKVRQVLCSHPVSAHGERLTDNKRQRQLRYTPGSPPAPTPGPAVDTKKR